VSSTRPEPANAERAPDFAAQQPVEALPRTETLEQSVLRSLEQYFSDLDGARPHALHELVMHAVERPLLKFAVDRCAGNQSAAADLLGINRNTLRRKLVDYGLL
jgi:Fis family transcriptional regulator, factor for inversion stimulation protein